MQRHLGRLVAILAVIGLFFLASGPVPAEAQAGAAGAQAIPRALDGKPDFSGFWDQPHKPGTRAAGATVFDKATMPPFKPGGEALFYEPRTGDPRHDEPRAFCMPSGFPSGLFGPYPIQIVQTPKWLVMVGEFQRITRLIPLDGRPHRADVEPTYYGDSVGRWEGDTLIIESRNFKRWSLDDYYYQDPKQYRMHSEEFRTTERLRRTNANTISYQITIEDPKIFTAPWSMDLEMTLHPEWEKVGLYEFVCEENNRCPGGNCRKE
jgi:hypothetical protein